MSTEQSQTRAHPPTVTLFAMTRFFVSAAFVLATAALVHGDNAPPTVPLDAQIGLLDFPVRIPRHPMTVPRPSFTCAKVN